MANLIVAPTIPSLTIGPRVFTDVKNLITLTGFVNGTTTVNTTMRQLNGSAGYTPSGAKAFRILAIRLQMQLSAVTSGVAGQVLYSDNDVGLNTASAFTNPKYPGNSASSAYVGCQSVLTNTFEAAYDFLVLNGKFPGWTSGSSAYLTQQIFFYGYEE